MKKCFIILTTLFFCFQFASAQGYYVKYPHAIGLMGIYNLSSGECGGGVSFVSGAKRNGFEIDLSYINGGFDFSGFWQYRLPLSDATIYYMGLGGEYNTGIDMLGAGYQMGFLIDIDRLDISFDARFLLDVNSDIIDPKCFWFITLGIRYRFAL